MPKTPPILHGTNANPVNDLRGCLNLTAEIFIGRFRDSFEFLGEERNLGVVARLYDTVLTISKIKMRVVELQPPVFLCGVQNRSTNAGLNYGEINFG